MPSLSDSSSDDDGLMLPGSKPTSNAGGGGGKPPLSGASQGGWSGGAPASTGSGSAGSTEGYAAGLLAKRRAMSQQRRNSPSPKTSLAGSMVSSPAPNAAAKGGASPTTGGPTSFAAAANKDSSNSPVRSARNKSPAPAKTPVASPTTTAPAPAPAAPITPVVAPAAPAAEDSPKQPVAKAEEAPPAPPAAPPKPAEPPVEERIKALQLQIEEKKALIARSKEEEKTLLEAQAQRKQEYDSTFQRLEKEVRDLRRDAEEERGRVTSEIMNAEQDHEKFLRQERQRIEESVMKESEPEIQALRDQLAELKERKTKLSHGITTSSANRDVVNAAISSAMHSIIDRLRGDFEEKVLNDETWEEKVRTLVRTEVGDSVTKALRGDEAAEKKEQQKAFEDMLEFWRQAEDEERQHILKMDEQLLLDLNAMAGDDLDRMHREEMTMQQVYMEGREAWARHHRVTMNEELEGTVRRRDNEFNDLRKERGDLHQLKLKQIEDHHKTVMERMQEVHDKEMKAVRDEYSAKQLLREERSKAHIEAQEKASEAVAALEEAAKDFEKLIVRIDDYRSTLDKSKDDVQQQKIAQLQEQEQALNEIQELITSQSSAMDAERRSLAGTVVKLEVVDSALNKQMEEERTWLGQLVNKLERSKSDWEREYRRWQHLTQQEQQAVEQRFSSILLDLRAAGSALEDENRQLDLEAASLKKRCEERAARSAQEVANIQSKEDAVQERYQAMMTVASDLEVKGQHLAAEWEALHDERQKLGFRRQDLAKEKVKMDQLSLQLQDMRRAVDTANMESTTMAERTKVLQRQIQASQSVMDYDGKALREQGSKLAQERDRLASEQSRLNDLATRQHMRYANAAKKAGAQATGGHSGGGASSRLPARMMAELQEVLTAPTGTTAASSRQSGGSGGAHHHQSATAGAPQRSHYDPNHSHESAGAAHHGGHHHQSGMGGKSSMLSPSNMSTSQFGGGVAASTVVPLDPSLPPSNAGGDDSSFTPLEDIHSSSQGDRSSVQGGGVAP